MKSTNKLAGIALCSLGLFVGAPAHADREATNVFITTLTVNKPIGNIVFIRANAEPTGTTSCHTNSSWHFTLSIDDAAGKSMYAMLLAAAPGKQLVALAGLGACNEFSGIESLRAIGGVY